MEASHRSRRRTKAPSLLSSYRWQAAPRDGEKQPDFAPSPASGRRGKQQRRRRAQSQTESELSEPNTEQKAPTTSPPDSRAAAKRSVFQRAFSTPSQEPKAQEGGSKLNLRKYWRSISHWKSQEAVPQAGRNTKEARKGAGSTARQSPSSSSDLATAPDAALWDVAKVSLMDGQLVLLGRDEQNLLQTRKRTSSSVSEMTSVSPVLCDQMNYGASTDGRGFLDTPRHVPERKPPQEGSSGPQLSSVKGLLWKRLRDRKERAPAKADSPSGPAASGHRDVPPGPELLLDLANEKEVLIRPLHSSLLGKQHCFEVLSVGGRRCFTCASATERTRWMEDLRRAVQPSQDNCERKEHILSLWVYEARDLAPRRPCFCELRLDGTLYARTTAKPASPAGEVFWGEHFDLRSLPPALQLHVCLVEEEEGQRHKGRAVADVAIPLRDLSAARQPLEKWYPMGKGKPSVPTLRLRGRYCSIHVLPIVQYKEFAEYLTFHYRELCATLECSLSARDKEELARALVRILQSTGKAKAFLIDLGIAELDRFDEREALIFRENTLATKAIDEYMKLVGEPYLLATLSDVVAHLYSLKDTCEVDPSKCALSELDEHRNHLQQLCAEVFQRIEGSTHSFPAELNEVFTAWQEECQLRGKAGIGQRLISASLFLRFLCPAVMSPSLFGLTQEYPDDATSRTLILVAKVIQNLANFTRFGEKEAYMSFMNDFLESKAGAMTAFLSRVSGPCDATPFADCGEAVDLALELSVLHSLLCDIFSTLEERTQERLEPLPTILRAIQKGAPVPVSVQLGPSAADQRGTGNQKPGFVPPRELGKHNPLVKSHSMTSIQKARGKEEPLAPSSRPKASKVQRTQSVPTQSKAARHTRKQGSTEHVAKGRDGGAWPSDSQPCGSSSSQASREHLKGPPPGSLPRKPTVPWLRHSEEAAATQGGFYAVQPLEQCQRRMEELQSELASAQEKQRRCEEHIERLAAQNQGLVEEQARLQKREETLCKRLEDMEGCVAQLNSRLPAMESGWKKDRERLQSTEERATDLELRLSRMERDHDQLLQAVGQMLGYQGKRANPLQQPLPGPVWVDRAVNGNET